MRWRLVLICALPLTLGASSDVEATHIWPVDWPLIYPGDSSVQHDVSGVLGEYRETGHFHGGVDIAEMNFTDVYSVRGDYNYVVSEGFEDRIAIREWYVINGGSGGNWDQGMDGQDDEWMTHWYLHVDSRQVYYRDLIVNNPDLQGRQYNPQTGFWEYPRHLYIAYIYYPPAAHLHFEEEYHNGFEDAYPFPGCTLGRYKYNPLYELAPFVDGDEPVIEEALLYAQGESTPLTQGSGTFGDPYIVSDETTGLDVRVHTHDVVSYLGTYDVALWALQYQLFDWQGQHMPQYDHAYGFSWLGPVDLPTVPDTVRYVSLGLGWVYDGTVSTNSEYYYWVTNNYTYKQEGSDEYLDITSLNPWQKFEIRVAVRDIQENYDLVSVWFMKAVGGVAQEPQQGDRAQVLAVYPNPTSSTATISYYLRRECTAKMEIYDVTGRIVRTLVSSPQMGGSLEVSWNGRSDLGDDLPSGVYLCRFEAQGEVQTQKILLLK